MKLENLYITTSHPMQHHQPASAPVVKNHLPDVFEKTVEIAYGVQPKPFAKAEIEVVQIQPSSSTPATTTTSSSPPPLPWETDASPPPFKAVPEVIQVSNRRVSDFLDLDLAKNDLQHIGEILVGEGHDYGTKEPEILSKPLSPNPHDNLLRLGGCNIYGEMYKVGDVIRELSDECSECKCTDAGVQCNNSCK